MLLIEMNESQCIGYLASGPVHCKHPYSVNILSSNEGDCGLIMIAERGNYFNYIYTE